MSKKDEWFAHWFDDVFYTKLYGHRDAQEATRAVDLFVRTCNPKANSSVIDVGCGCGRHSIALRKHGLRVTGLDLSSSLLALAKRSSTEFADITWQQQDMRITFPSTYDAVTSFFTSFGYFDSVEDDKTVIANMNSALAPNGVIFFDFLNAQTVRSNIVARDEQVIDGVRFAQEREIIDNLVVKHITIASDDGEQKRTESVRLYELQDFEKMFEREGLRITDTFGEYDGSAFEASQSSRLIMKVVRMT